MPSLNNFLDFIEILSKLTPDKLLMEICSNFSSIKNDTANPYFDMAYLESLQAEIQTSSNNEKAANDKIIILKQELMNAIEARPSELAIKLQKLIESIRNFPGKNTNISKCVSALQAIEKFLISLTNKNANKISAPENGKTEEGNKDEITSVNVDINTYTCSISRQVFFCPVTCIDRKGGSNNYELASLVEWVKKGNLNSPDTGLAIMAVTINFEMRQTINNLKNLQGQRHKSYSHEIEKNHLKYLNEQINPKKENANSHTKQKLKKTVPSVPPNSSTVKIFTLTNTGVSQPPRNSPGENSPLIPQSKKISNTSIKLSAFGCFKLSAFGSFFVGTIPAIINGIGTGSTFLDKAPTAYDQVFNKSLLEGCQQGQTDFNIGRVADPEEIYNIYNPPSLASASGVGIAFGLETEIISMLAFLGMRFMLFEGSKSKGIGIILFIGALLLAFINYAASSAVKNITATGTNTGAFNNGYEAGYKFNALNCTVALQYATLMQGADPADFSPVPVSNTTHPYTATFLAYPTFAETLVLCGGALLAGALFGVFNEIADRCTNKKDMAQPLLSNS